MTDKIFSKSGLPIRRSVELLPSTFQTDTNDKFLSGAFDSLIQPGALDKIVGYIGRRYGKTYNGTDIYLDNDNTLRSRYQLEPGVVSKDNDKITNFYDYIDFKNQLKFFGHLSERDNNATAQDHYAWNPPIDWDKFVNFREYYWIPDGPPPVEIRGQRQNIVSTYRVKLGDDESTYVFFPDGFKKNPTLTLYRGQTYKFVINAPGNGLVLRTSYDVGSLTYNPDFGYKIGQLAVFDGSLWRALRDIPFTEGSTINEQSEDWEYVEPASQAVTLDYNKGVKNNGIANGTLTFEVPLDAPDVLYYQSITDPDRLGRFIIADIDSNTKINIIDEVIGKSTYTSSNNVPLSNGMVVYFSGQISPEKYSKDTWVVEGVGDQITLTRFQDLVPPNMGAGLDDVLFDNGGFDSEPFDDATLYPSKKDYILINRSSNDLNPWSRYNRWFHRSVLEFSHKFNNTDFDAVDTARAKRPIIEFEPNLQLFNHGFKIKQSVDFIDTFTTDIFSIIEGSQGYSVDGQELFEGARVLFTADTDRLANNKIYEVNFINHSVGSSYRAEWDAKSSYRTGETVRFNGQSFSAIKDSRSYDANIVFSSNITNRFRVLKNLNIVRNLAVTFEGQPFGGVVENQIYYVVDVINSDPNATEFSVSLNRAGFPISLTLGAPGQLTMTAYFAAHPTDFTVWGPSPDRRQITLRKVEDSEPLVGESLLVKRGNKNQGIMFHFTGIEWTRSQEKIKINVSPLFDSYDNDGISFADQDRYPVSSFVGTKILSYKIGNSTPDPELGISLSYLNINNIGDISFNFDWESDSFRYEQNRNEIEKYISSGFLLKTDTTTYLNCWISADKEFAQAIVDSVVIQEPTNVVTLDAIKWNNVSEDSINKVLIYVNGFLAKDGYFRQRNNFIFDSELDSDTVITVKVYADADPENGYYEIPAGLEKNPLNQKLISFTLGEATDHIESAVNLYDEFSGNYPGVGNLRDITGYQNLASRFLKHSGIAPTAITMLCDKEINIVKALEYSTNAYREYKNKFLQLASTLDFNQSSAQLVDDVIVAMTKVKKLSDTFADSDMLGAGAYRQILYTVEDTEIKVFALSEKFDLDTASRRAVYVYKNSEQLLVNQDYTFNSNFGFVQLTIELEENDVIEIREYANTAFSFMPATPTKLGLYKKYLPQKYLDDTYLEPTEVIQGHDGSITVAYGDYRDDVLLELEKRIYNNIKNIYSTEIFDIDKIFGSRYYTGVYSKQETDRLIARQFRRWLQVTNTSSKLGENTFFDQTNPFTFTYSLLSDAQGSKLPGFWRGIYQWYYNTDRPHITPWEMLGFSEKPTWWESQYGPAPYTSNNLLLWEDLRDGIIRQGSATGTYDRYKRPTILNHIPVDGDGKLLDPLTSNLVGEFPLTRGSKNFQFGDISPVENSWRKSSDYPFAVLTALSVMIPFEFLIENFDKNLITVNKLGQTVCKHTNEFLTLSDLQFPVAGEIITSGLVNYLSDYLKSAGKTLDRLKNKLVNIDVNLSSRLSGFVDKAQQRYILDSKNPSAKSNSVFIPQENYDIIFNVSAPIKTLTYSGIIVEKSSQGYRVYGYDTIDPVFRYYEPYVSESVPITVGGESERAEEWQAGKIYANGVLVRYRSEFYRSIKSHTSDAKFDTALWKKLPSAPLVNSVTVLQKTQFDKSQIKELEYGTDFSNIQSLTDFVCGYQAYLIDQGFEFDEYDADLIEVRNWITSIKEFMMWTRSNWAEGSLISLSPAANKITISTEVGILENLLDGFYDYQILQNSGRIVQPTAINVNRQYQKITIETANQADGIYFFKGHLILKEHVTIFSDRTVFNDVLYDKTAGYRQGRVKSRGFRTSDWDGDYTSPGFLFDNVDINTWQPYVDYKLGDIVRYKSYNWTSLEKQNGTLEFDETKWSKLDSTPERQLVPNFDFRVSQIEDYYNVDADGASSIQRSLARHAVGYQTREYLEELSEDQVTQFKLYQGFIREKGTTNAVVKVFDKLKKSNSSKIELKEEWALQTGILGGVDQRSYIEFEIDKGSFKLNPQPLVITSSSQTTDNSLNINVDQSKFTYAPVPFTSNIFSTELYRGLSRSAGYVNESQVDITLASRADFLNLDIDTVQENSHIWITFDSYTWTVLRFNQTNSLYIVDINIDRNFITFRLNRPHTLNVGDYFGIKNITQVKGFKIVDRVTDKFSISIKNTSLLSAIDYDFTSVTYDLCIFTTVRHPSFNKIDLQSIALSKPSSKLWIDKNSSDSDKWQVVEKQSQYTLFEFENFRIDNAKGIGQSILHAPILKQTLVGIAQSGFVAAGVEKNNTVEVAQILGVSEERIRNSLNNSFGSSLAISPDEQWLAVGAPRASGVPSRFEGDFNPAGIYGIGSIVLYRGRLWRAINDVFGDGSSINELNQDWEPADIINTSESGVTGKTNQGAIFLFQRRRNQWIRSTDILSPRITENELFGSSISISVSNGKYHMAVSAPGAISGTGRVYMFVYENSNWKIQDNTQYAGLFESRQYYVKDSVVWHENNLWKAKEDVSQGNAFNADNWILTSSFQTFLPFRSTYNEIANIDKNDSTLSDSTLAIGILDEQQLVELVKPGDNFGHAVSMNRDGSILIVSAPESDRQYFDNFKGLWNSYSAYTTGDVVRYVDPLTQRSSYRELYDPRSDNDPNTDSSQAYVSISESPEGDPWKEIGDSSNLPTGKIFIYARTDTESYKLIQTVSAENINDINDTEIERQISSGSQFGFAIDTDSSGLTIVVSSPKADINFQSQGSVYVLRRSSLTSQEFRLVQRLQSYEEYPNELFGSSVSINTRGESIVVGASNASYRAIATFDNTETLFDNGRTRITENRGFPGQVYVYDKRDQTYLLGEKLDADLQNFESFGATVDISEDIIIIGSPNFRKIVPPEELVVGQSYIISILGNTDWQAIGVSQFTIPMVGLQFIALAVGSGSGVAQVVENTGTVRFFKRNLNKQSWNIISEETESINFNTIKSIAIYDQENNINLGNIDIVDNFKLRILGVAEQELSYKTIYNPAVYTNIGESEETELDPDRAWFSENVGKLWWDLSAVKFYYAEQEDLAFKEGYWNKQVIGSAVNIYEWVESKYTPTQWKDLADTNAGLAQGISGEPLSLTSFSIKELFDALSGQTTGTRYYFWVKNKNTIPVNAAGRKLPAAEVSKLIASPESASIPFVAIASANEILAWNFKNILNSEKALINIEYISDEYNETPVHKEYQLLTEGVADSLPSREIEQKWIDSLVGYDLSGKKVPDISLPEKQKYGLKFRPRQSMFVDRYLVLESIIDNINNILKTRAFADTINYGTLSEVELPPIFELNEYDVEVDQLIDLSTIGTVRVKPAVLRANIVDGSIESITIVDSGFGYKVPPSFIINGNGAGANIRLLLDSQGRVSSVSIISPGQGYTFVTITIRKFSVLVKQDNSVNNYWAIYSWDNVQRIFTKSKIQGYDTRRYWRYADWFAPGISTTSRIIEEIDNFYREPSLTLLEGDIIKISEFANGGWALLQRTSADNSDIANKYKLVGRQFGTIEIIKDSFIPPQGFGLDSIATFDGNLYDLQPSFELRNILKAVKEDIFTDDLTVEWNKLFFTSLRYSFVQLPVVDWAFKTSFINAVHNVGELDQRISYKNDNLESYQSYIEEVKPYRTTIREYTSVYQGTDAANSAVSDFDSPPTYSVIDGTILPVDNSFNNADQYPWKWFVDNQGYEIVSINLISAGSGYTSPPRVLITGSGVGATARAFISNGRVSGIEVTNPGQGYTAAPTISLVGGNGNSADIARAAAVLGNSLIRTFNVSLKFDRIGKLGSLEKFSKTEILIAPGFTSTFNLQFAPTTDKSKISVVKNGQIVLDNEYFITLYKSNVDGFNLTKGKITFVEALTTGTRLEIIYDINDEFLDSVNRIQKYYSPNSGMTGKDLPQLMTGIDFGGVQIQGTTFDVTGGWDALPWFTDSWDSVEASADYYVVCDGSTTNITLPFIPADGQQITVYIKRAAPEIAGVPPRDKTNVRGLLTRIDDPNYTDAWDSSVVTNPGAQMPTFVGDGSTSIVEIGQYIQTVAGDTLIFRPIESDGAVTIRDTNILDTQLSGGSLASMAGAYSTATGFSAEDIVISGGKFTEPDHVPAPEENVPGQVLESVSIKVYHTRPQAAAPLQNKVYVANGVDRIFNIGLDVFDNRSVMVYVDKNKIEQGYTIDFALNRIEFDQPLLVGQVLEIISIGIGGINLLDYQEFIADGETDLFLTNAVYNQTTSIIVTVNGEETDAIFLNSEEFTDTVNRTIVQLGFKPRFEQVIKIVAMGQAADVDSAGLSFIRVNSQQTIFDGSTNNIELDGFVNLARSAASSSLLVEVNGQSLKGPDTIYREYNGTDNTILLGVDPFLAAGSISLNDVVVYFNNELQEAIVAYTFNTGSKVLTLNSELLTIGDEIKVEVTVLSNYFVVNENLVFSDDFVATLSADDVVDITWFSEYPSFDIISDQYKGGQPKYQLKRTPLNSSYVWVYVNGLRLSAHNEYSVNIQQAQVVLNIPSTQLDDIKIIEFGNDVWTLPNAYEVHKDMLNIYHYNRYSAGAVRLSKDLNYYDLQIEVTDASTLAEPNAARNIAGVVEIGSERIEYLQKSGNVLSQLRRGYLGTSVAESHIRGSNVVNVSAAESIPYNDQQDRYDFVSDGSTLLIGPLDFVPTKSTRVNWFKSTISEDYGPCDQLEIFVGGQRLRKDPLDLYNEELGSYSPAADEKIEAEFSVDGDNPYIKLTNAVPAGTRITMIRRTGKTWNDRSPSATTASNGITLHKNTNPIVSFILQKSTAMPE
jgi:hypothetical protein